MVTSLIHLCWRAVGSEVCSFICTGEHLKFLPGLSSSCSLMSESASGQVLKWHFATLLTMSLIRPTRLASQCSYSKVSEKHHQIPAEPSFQPTASWSARAGNRAQTSFNSSSLIDSLYHHLHQLLCSDCE